MKSSIAIRVRPANANQKGVALAMLLWFIAAMAILVAGIVAQGRTDIKLTQLQLQQLQAEAAGDGASLLLLRDLIALQEQDEYAGRGIFEQTYTLGTHSVKIRAVPISGLIDLNLASEGLLEKLFNQGAGLGEEQVKSLVSNVIAWRIGGDAEQVGHIENQDQSRTGQFEVLEDLLQVEGMSREIYDSVSQLAYVAQKGQDGLDPVSAPEEVLNVLTGIDGEQMDEYMQQRLENPFGDTGVESVIDSQFIAAGIYSLFRLDAKIKFEDGKVYQRRRWVRIEAGDQGIDGLPWRFTRTEPVIAIETEHFSVLEAVDG